MKRFTNNHHDNLELLSDFDGHLVRIAYDMSKGAKAELMKMEREDDDEHLTTLVFTQRIQGSILCGDKLCITSSERQSIQVLSLSGIEDRHGWFRYATITREINLEHLWTSSILIKPCTSLFVLHSLYEKHLDIDQIAKCNDFMQVYFSDSHRIFVIDLAQKCLPIVRDVSSLKQIEDPEEHVMTGYETPKIRPNNSGSYYTCYSRDNLQHRMIPTALY